MTEDDRVVAVTAVTRDLWGDLSRRWWSLRWRSFQDDFLAGLDEMVGAVSAGQATAAGIGAGFANDQADAHVRVNPDAIAGTASDGRSLAGLLAQPMVRTFAAAAAGATPAIALDFGAQSLERIVSTQVEDAARAGEQVAIGGNTHVRGYVRVVEPKACGRCVVLAGRFYRWNEGFRRHPSCRCSHRPVTNESAADPQDPKAVFDAMSAADQDRAFTTAGAEAIRLGADPAKVVNARRGMSTATSPSGRQILVRRNVLGQPLYTTTAGAGKGRTGRRRAPVRLMPESILELATDRADAIRLLEVHGYLN